MRVLSSLLVLVLLLGASEPQNPTGQPAAVKSFSAKDGTDGMRDVRWIQEEEADWDAVYERFLEENEGARKKIESGMMTKAEMIEWLKENEGGGEFKKEKGWIDRNVTLFIVLDRPHRFELCGVPFLREASRETKNRGFANRC